MKTLIAIAACLVSINAFAFDESITVRWNDPGSEDGFEVLRSDTTCAAASGISWATVATPGPGVVSYIDPVQDNATYCYQVRAIKSGQPGPLSASVEVVVPASLDPVVATAALN